MQFGREQNTHKKFTWKATETKQTRMKERGIAINKEESPETHGDK